MPRNTLQQQRASFVFNELGKKPNAELAKLAKKMPMMLRANGLGQTVAYLSIQNRDPFTQYNNLLQDWLRKCGVIEDEQAGFMKFIRDADHVQYVAALRETYELADWIKKISAINQITASLPTQNDQREEA